MFFRGSHSFFAHNVEPVLGCLMVSIVCPSRRFSGKKFLLVNSRREFSSYFSVTVPGWILEEALASPSGSRNLSQSGGSAGMSLASQSTSSKGKSSTRKSSRSSTRDAQKLAAALQG